MFGFFNNNEKKFLNACVKNDVILVKEFINKGIDINCSDGEGGFTPIMMAAYKGGIETANLLIASGANINCQDNFGNTALIYAVKKSNTEIVKLLIEAGADINITNSENMTALIIAINENNIEIAKLLVESDINAKTNDNFGMFLISVASFGKLEFVKLFIEFGINIDFTSDQMLGMTPLMMAAGNGHLEVVKFLVESGANINLQNDVTNKTTQIICDEMIAARPAESGDTTPAESKE